MCVCVFVCVHACVLVCVSSVCMHIRLGCRSMLHAFLLPICMHFIHASYVSL